MLNTVLGSLSVGVTPSTNSYESIATVTVGSGGAANVEFTSIPSNFKHLQIRILAKTNRSTYASDSLIMSFNSDSTSNYSFHAITGDGGGIVVQGVANTYIYDGFELTGTVNSSGFGGLIYDILDYSDTSKYKTSRTLGGFDTNGTVAGYGGHIGLSSGSWRNTAAINSIKFVPQYGSLISQYSHFALYGIKGA